MIPTGLTWHSDKKDGANRVLSTSIITGLGLGVIFMVLCRFTIQDLVYLLGATDECAAFSMQYATYVLYAAPFMIGSFILNMCLRSEGSAMYSMIGIGFGGVLNCFLDPLFIFSFGMGIKGAAIATVLAQIVALIYVASVLSNKRDVIHLHSGIYGLRKRIVKSIPVSWSSSSTRD